MARPVLVTMIMIQAIPGILTGISWRLALDLGSISKYKEPYTGSQELSRSLVPAFKVMEKGLNELHDTLQSNSNYDLLSRVIITGIFFMLVVLALLSRFDVISKLKKAKAQPQIPFHSPNQPGYPGWVNKV